MRTRIECAGASDVGQLRSDNEDQFLIAELAPAVRIESTSVSLRNSEPRVGLGAAKLMIIADGMGGHVGGERASSLAIQGVLEYLLSRTRWSNLLTPDGHHDLQTELAAAIEHCQNQILRDAEKNPERSGMGTTLTLGVIVDRELFVAHVGDSRCYLWRDGRLAQLTRDHTVAQQFVEHGELNPQQAEKSRWSSVLWNVVGGDSRQLHTDMHQTTLQAGDKLLLCSDGLTRHVRPERIAKILDQQLALEESCRRLIAEANAAGGRDNITVIAAQVSPVYSGIGAERSRRGNTDETLNDTPRAK